MKEDFYAILSKMRAAPKKWLEKLVYLKENGFIGRSTHAYYRVYQEVAETLQKEEEVTITYRDFSKALVLDPLTL